MFTTPRMQGVVSAHEALAEAYSPQLKRVLVITRGTGKSGGVAQSVRDMFDEIFEVDLLGNVLERYIR